MEIETKNARITSTFLGVEDHGIPTFTLFLDYGGTSQGAGDYSLGGGDPRVWGSCELLFRIMEVVGVDSWEALKGQHIRAKADRGKVYAIGNFLKDDWLDFEQFFLEHHKPAALGK